MAMKSMAIAFCSLVLIDGRALGLVGDAQLATGDIARSVVGIVGIVGSSHSFCTATAIARNLLLTAGHCVRPGTHYKVQYKDTNGLRQFFDIVEWERPPQFIMRASAPPADLALLKLANPLPADIGVAMLGLNQTPIWPGDRFTVIGGYTDLQIRLIDTSGQQITIGACGGDSGSPVFQTKSDGTKVIGVVSWAAGPNKTKGCGGITGATPLSPYRQWIEETVTKWGGMPGADAAPR